MIPGDEIDTDGYGKHFKAICIFAAGTVQGWGNSHNHQVPTVEQMVEELHFQRDFAELFLRYAREKGWIRDE